MADHLYRGLVTHKIPQGGVIYKSLSTIAASYLIRNPWLIPRLKYGLSRVEFLLKSLN